ncbi:MAG: helicase-related protein, partial [bacterium]
MLDLLQRLKGRTQSLLLLTATPMQVHPVEVWDLLDLLGLPQEWNETNFLRFCEVAEKPASSPEEIEFLATLFRASEQQYGAASELDGRRAGATSGLQSKRIMAALRDPSVIPRRQMDNTARAIALRLIRSRSPIGRLISRHTRDLLRRYHEAGKLATPIASREVEDRFVPLSPEEASIYEAVENYISTTYNQASAKEKNAVGFVMTIYRRRLASSFHALRHTLEDHLNAMSTGQAPRNSTIDEDDDEGVGSTNADGDALSTEERTAMERQSLAQEEKSDIAGLLDRIRCLPPDTKSNRLQDELASLRAEGYTQAMVFTQYTDTMDFLRDTLVTPSNIRIMCYSGRGGEVCDADGRWRTISREEAKRIFRDGKADILLCTDAAAEGLNFQFCGAIVNYDMPWNPMRVEQRIGRIDRLGQKHVKIRIINLHYEGTVEADVYMALRRRINLFQSVVGRLQPILARMPSLIAGQLLKRHGTDPDARAALVGDLERDAETAKNEGLDLDAIIDADLEEPKRPRARLTLQDLDLVLNCPEALPPGLALRKLQSGEYACQAPGQGAPVRITT